LVEAVLVVVGLVHPEAAILCLFLALLILAAVAVVVDMT
jgi:hypothetical protein